MKNLGKILAGVAFVMVLGVVWLFQNGGLARFTSHAESAPVQEAPAAAATATPEPVAPSANFQAQTDALKSIQTNGIVRVSVENPSAPFYTSSNGALPEGFNVDFAKLLFADSSFASADKPITIDMHHEVDTYAGVPKQLLATDANGHHTVDIAMDGLTFPDNTPQGVKYSKPYVTDFGYALIVKAGSGIRTVADLSGKRVGVLKGDPDVRSFVSDQYPDATIVSESDADANFIVKSIDSGDVDAFIYDYPFAVAAIRGSDLRFAVTKLDGSNLSYKIGVRTQDQSLLVYLNAAIANVTQSPAYLDLLRKYFVSDQASTQAAASGERTYTVKARDTLNLIASSQLGNGSRYREIQKRNNLPNPNLITIGQALVIPTK